MKKARMLIAAFVAVAGIGGAFSRSNSVAPRARVNFCNGNFAIRDLATKGQDWDCKQTDPTACYYYESVPDSGNFDVESNTRGCAFDIIP